MIDQIMSEITAGLLRFTLAIFLIGVICGAGLALIGRAVLS